MSDNEQKVPEHVIDIPEEETSPDVAAKPKQRQLTQKQLDNLARAREARRANTLTKRPVEKRARATEFYEADVEKRARKKAHELAEKLLAEKEKERELKELRQLSRKWRRGSNQKKLQSQRPLGKKAPSPLGSRKPLFLEERRRRIHNRHIRLKSTMNPTTGMLNKDKQFTQALMQTCSSVE